MSERPSEVVKAIDKAVRDREDLRPPRGHLGASQIGGRCARQAWYQFRWAYLNKFTGRMLRLFRRGHEEEHNFVGDLRAAGFEVRDYTQRLMYHDGSDSYTCVDWDDTTSEVWAHCDDVSEDRVHIKRATDRRQGPAQWGFVDHRGHYRGNNDGKIRGGMHGLPEGFGGLEFKTANDKSFKQIVEKGVLQAKPVHWVQMQEYMLYLGLDWCLYMVVNKNDDHIHEELVFHRPEVSEQYKDIAKAIIEAKQAPARLTNNPTWFECKFCAFREICHYDDVPHKNCRSCVFAEPHDDGEWYCNKYHAVLPKQFIPQGCDQWGPVK